jgi:acyl-CoA thioester hydrolase
VYYDYGAMARMKFLSERGLSTAKLEEFKVGPILFREEAIFRKEIKLEDNVYITTELSKSTEDFSRWSLRHNFFKEPDILATILTIDGAWMDIEKRKLAKPNDFIQDIFRGFERSGDFEWMSVGTKVS